MTHELHAWPRALRDYADATGTKSGSSGERCRRCHARLRLKNHATLCAPCASHLGIHPPPPRPVSPRVCPDCGMAKHYEAARCRACHTLYYRENHL